MPIVDLYCRYPKRLLIGERRGGKGGGDTPDQDWGTLTSPGQDRGTLNHPSLSYPSLLLSHVSDSARHVASAHSVS